MLPLNSFGTAVAKKCSSLSRLVFGWAYFHVSISGRGDVSIVCSSSVRVCGNLPNLLKHLRVWEHVWVKASLSQSLVILSDMYRSRSFGRVSIFV